MKFIYERKRIHILTDTGCKANKKSESNYSCIYV